MPGGNRVELKGVELTKEEELFSRDKKANLHAFWDSSYRRTFRDGKARVLYDAPIYDKEKPVAGHAAALDLIRKEADAIKMKYPPSIGTEQKDVAGWVQESHEAGYDFSYGKLGPIKDRRFGARRRALCDRLVRTGAKTRRHGRLPAGRVAQSSLHTARALKPGW